MTDQQTNQFTIAHAPGDTAVPVVKNIFGVSADFLGELKTWLEQNPPAIPITSVLGFSQFVGNFGVVSTAQTTASTSYTNLSTVGPTISGLSDGKYLVLWASRMQATVSTGTAEMAISVNGAAAPGGTNALSAQATVSTSTVATPVMFDQVTLNAGGNNSITAKYKTGAGTIQFSQRVMFALRYSNL
ncbi:MAG TPA: hypothetical protein VF190_11745 [Rhodothermales bacterium]